MVEKTRGDEAVKYIVDYMEKNLAKGYKIDGLKWALINQKYSKIEIDKAIKIIEARRPVNKLSEEVKEPKIEIINQEISMPEKKGFWKNLFG